NLFSRKRMYIPVNLTNTHWCMLVVSLHTRPRTVQWFDSYNRPGTKYVQAIKHWLGDEALARGVDIGNLDARAEWTYDRGISPQQYNCCDCGVFSLMCADFMSDDLPLDYAEGGMAHFRTKIAASIIRGCI
ncbi:hypothetical protein B484DRAFT_313206, partial [Ochromonadaceae sp. CCMP2298]